MTQPLAPLNKGQRMSTKTAMAVFAMFTASLMATSANAHPTLKSGDPPAEGVAATAPTEIKLNFCEGVSPKFSSVELKDQAGTQMRCAKGRSRPRQ